MKSQNSASKRFLSDFTLGFSDGLTVPFALTAGLSSLGKTDTVITGGLAELCAGSISMGIGGYLAARDQCTPCDGEQDVEEGQDDYERTNENDSMVDRSEKIQMLAEDMVRQHLEPLHLPSSTVTTLINGMTREPAALQQMVSRLRSSKDLSSTQDSPQSPIISGLSISLGYAIGGTIPLLPYFFTSTVGLGLQWSFCLCLMVLFGFGAGKSWILTKDAKFRTCVVEGLQMLVLGAIAATAAVACVAWVGNT
ncbi:vacuolar iron transporter [Fusarium heterosporum]|uniref:Vacuolar iron transporter n=1 Tax=Fusarium heterosporum TaxID=42747 RepID=A0A8H5WP81_FUSHE|nr:vacuolar iron transporter [Fusarium heterosporum]